MSNHMILSDDLQRADAPESNHDVWAKQKIELALQKKQDGRANYKSLREVAAKYDLDAS
jgi:hypothetical protein